MNQEIIDFGTYFTPDGVKTTRRGLEEMGIGMSSEAKLKLTQMIEAVDQASSQYGDMITICTPQPFQQDFVTTADKMIREGLPVEAVAKMLSQFINECPKDWKPMLETPEGDIMFFWNDNEFKSYVDYYRPTLRKCIRWLFPSYSKAHYLMAYCLIELGHLEQGLGHLDKGLVLEPNHPKLLTEKGTLLAKMGFEREALELLRRSTTSRPWNTKAQITSAYRELAIVSGNLNLFQDAYEALNAAIALFPDDPTLKEDMSGLIDSCNGVLSNPE